MVLVRRREAVQNAHDEVWRLFIALVVLVRAGQSFVCGEEKECREHEQQGLEALDGRQANEYEDGPEYHRAPNAEVQTIRLQMRWHLKVFKQCQKDEQIVDGQRVFDHIGCDKVQPRSWPTEDVKSGGEHQRASHGKADVGEALAVHVVHQRTVANFRSKIVHLDCDAPICRKHVEDGLGVVAFNDQVQLAQQLTKPLKLEAALAIEVHLAGLQQLFRLANTLQQGDACRSQTLLRLLCNIALRENVATSTPSLPLRPLPC
mmetsp:Transcript_93865/g.269045  ORF Transcript_93865/g.269045 Transcript_93865/m.269045 type:complete len:261 (+) Transcript_93865:681-1463(+)